MKSTNQDNVTGNSDCQCETCMLRETNVVFVFQVAYLIVCLAILLSDYAEITFITVAMFIMPQILDLIRFKPATNLSTIIKRFLLMLNVVLLTFCILELTPLIISYGDRYIVAETAVFLAGRELHKRVLAIMLIANIFVPIYLYGCLPNKASIRARKSMAKKNRTIESWNSIA